MDSASRPSPPQPKTSGVAFSTATMTDINGTMSFISTSSTNVSAKSTSTVSSTSSFITVISISSSSTVTSSPSSSTRTTSTVTSIPSSSDVTTSSTSFTDRLCISSDSSTASTSYVASSTATATMADVKNTTSSVSTSSTNVSANSTSTVTSTSSYITVISISSSSTVTSTSSPSTSFTATTSTTSSTSTAADLTASTSTPSTQASSTPQTQRVEFDDTYKQGMVYVLPPIQELKVNVFQETTIKIPLDPAMPYKTKTHAMQVDEAKLTSGQDKLKGDQDEACVLKLLYEQLQKATHPGDPPVFLFCSLMLSNHEKDIVIFYRKYGVIIVEVKGVKNPRSFSRLQKAAEQLLKARDAIRTELQGLLAPDAVSLLMALPNLTDAGNARQRMQILRDNPDIQLLCGREEADYKTFLQQLPTRPDPLVWEAQPDSHQAFVTAVSRYLSVEVYSPTETASELAQVHRSWLLTPDQAPVLHHHHRLLHLWGPPGAGKTLLLLHRVKLWLQDNKHVILCVGLSVHSVLLQHLGRATVSGNEWRFSHNLTLCRNYLSFQETVENLEGRASPENICVIVDEVERPFLSQALKAFQQRKIFCLWTASVEDIPDTESPEFHTLGGEKVLLPHCLRCPPHVVEVAGKVLQATPQTPAMTSFPCLPANMPTGSVKVCFHPSHLGYRLLDAVDADFRCEECSQLLRSSLSPLVEGLPLEHPKWRHWVIVYTGGYNELDNVVKLKMVKWLRRHGVPVVSEMEEDTNISNLPVSVAQQGPRGQGSEVRDERAEWRERVVSGKDRQGNTAVHCVPHDRYTGLEKPCVLVLHWDQEDDFYIQSHRDVKERYPGARFRVMTRQEDNPSNQSDSAARERHHREAWFQAMTRCQGELCVWLLSPSPAASCLPLSQEELDGWIRNQEEKWIQEEQQLLEERRRREDKLARQKREVQKRQRQLDEERRLSQKEMERCRQEEQRIQEEEQRIQEKCQPKERCRRGKELAQQTEEVQERRRRLEAKQMSLQDDMEMRSWEEQRIQMEEKQIQEEEGILEEERRRRNEAAQQMWEALQRRDAETALQIREELEQQIHKLRQRQPNARRMLKELEQQMRAQKERQHESRQRWEEDVQRLSQKKMEEWKQIQEEQEIQEEQRIQKEQRIQEEQRCRHEVILARRTKEVQGRRRFLEEEKRLSQEEIERCRQDEQQIQEEGQRIREKEQRIQKEEELIREERQLEERYRRGKELTRQTQEVQERRRRLEAKQRWLQEDMDMCGWEEQRIQIEEEEIQEEERILEEERRRLDEAVRQMREALQTHDLETARRIREELERQKYKLRRQLYEELQNLAELEL